MSRNRERNRQLKKSKKVILISCEGNRKNKTETLYFRNLVTRDSDFRIELVPGNETDPVSLVEQTINQINKLGLSIEEDDRAFCLIDTDKEKYKNTQIVEAKKLAAENGIIIITSNPCFEIWFLLHFECSTAPITTDKLLEKLKKRCPKYNKSHNIYPEIEKATLKAIENAKYLERFHLDDGKFLDTIESNPSTHVYKILEEIGL